jgi:hypothetical protein
MDSVEKLLKDIHNRAYESQGQSRELYGTPNELFKATTELLLQYKLPVDERNAALIRAKWKLLNSEGRKRKIFDGLSESVPEYVKDELRKFLGMSPRLETGQ